jgi:hypothetical protein
MPKSKQKQAQKQEQNVKVVINQNDNKKKRKQRRKPQTQSQGGPIPYGYTPAQQMRAYQTYTPQINNNAAADFSSVVNALRANMAMAMPVQQGPQLIRNPPAAVQAPLRIQNPPPQPTVPVQPVISPIAPPPPIQPMYTPLAPARQSIVPDFPGGRLNLTDFTPMRPLPQTVPRLLPRARLIDPDNLGDLLKTPSKLKGGYEFSKPLSESRATSMVPYNAPLPTLRSSIVINDEPVIRNVPFESLTIPQNAKTNVPAPNTIPRQSKAGRIQEPIPVSMEAGKDFPEPDIMGAKTNADIARELQLKLTKSGLPDKRTVEGRQWFLARAAEIDEP